MSFTPYRLDGAAAALVWEKVAPILAAAVESGAGMYALDDIRGFVTQPEAGTSRGWALWIMVDEDERTIVGAWLTLVKWFPMGGVLDIPYLAGCGLADWYEVGIVEVERFARECGCRRLRCSGRRGWKAFGWRAVATVFERNVE